jgi:hypothetical protein
LNQRLIGTPQLLTMSPSTITHDAHADEIRRAAAGMA